MKGVVIGTGGHVDHGKTALVRALTGVDTDRWEEEKRRGLTIDIGFAPFDLGRAGEGGIIDVPGHEDFLKNMLAGATGIDLLLLVVAADEGPMPQTSEHLAIASLLGVERGVVALTKTDRVDRAWLDLVREAVRDEVGGTFGGSCEWPIVEVSSATGEGLAELRAALESEATCVAPRPVDDLFRMPVDRAFTVHGTGTVVTGTIWSGRVAVGESVRVLPGRSEARIRSLQVHGRARNEVTAGRRCAMALVGLEAKEVPRGSVVVSEAEWRPRNRVGARLRLLRKPARPLEHGQRVRIHHGTREALARVLLPALGSIAPGSSDLALLKLEAPLVLRARDPFILRFYSPVTTIGGGRVADLEPGREWRERSVEWDRILDGSGPDVLRAVVRVRAGLGVRPAELPWLTGLDRTAVAGLLERPPEGVLVLGERWFDECELPRAQKFLRRRLADLHAERPRAPRASREALRAAAVRRFAPSLVDHALVKVVEDGEIVAEGPGVRLARHRSRLTRRERRALESVREKIAAAGPEPPTVEELAREAGLDRDLLNDLLILLEEEGAIVALTPEIYLTAEVLAELERRARAVLARYTVAPLAAFKESFGVTRKYLIPLLEHLDRVGVTRRTREGRELAG